jgi:hypothetical protein
MKFFVLLVAAVAAYGGYRLGRRDEDGEDGMMVSLLAAMIFAIPMGFWFVFNLFAYFIRGGSPGFRPADVGQVVSLLVVGVGAWFCGLVVGYILRKTTK